MAPPRRAISLVEKGWAGARRYSIELVGQGMLVEHVVRGQLSAAVLEIITPYPGMRIVSYSRRWYRVMTWWWLASSVYRRRRTMVIVDNPRAAQWVGAWFPMLRRHVVLIQEQPDGSPIVIPHAMEPDRTRQMAVPAG